VNCAPISVQAEIGFFGRRGRRASRHTLDPGLSQRNANPIVSRLYFQ
jgi:hypothetical protein